MNLKEFTNQFLKKVYTSGLDIDLDIRIDDTLEEPTPQIQIDIKNDLYKSFAVFYGLKDSKINYSSIFELKDEYIDDDFEVTHSKYRELKTIFNEDKGIFCDLILEDNNYLLHLFGEVDIDNLTEEIIDEICDFLVNNQEIKVLKSLKEASL
jgi:hypothetical protein